MQVGQIVELMQSIAPLAFAAEWDNVGLLVGGDSWPAARVMLTIDLTEPVLHEAIDADVQMIVAYHPPLFTPLRTLTERQAVERIILTAARSGIALYSPHTALDAAPGGINDWLASGLGGGDVRALECNDVLPESESHKVVTFCPAEVADALRKAMATSGAGRIGNYEICSFQIKGQGTFRGREGTKPAVGRAGHLEIVDEVRLEMVCPESALGLVIAALREFHPYEEPAIEIYRLHGRPQRHIGQGRRVMLDQALDLPTLCERLKRTLGVGQVRVAAAYQSPEVHQSIGLCAGAGGGLLATAAQQGCTVYVTGEMRHHDVLAGQHLGCTVILAGHTNTERGYLGRLRERLTEKLPEATTITISKRDADPLIAM